MTVRELMAELGKHDPDMPVQMILCDDYGDADEVRVCTPNWRCGTEYVELSGHDVPEEYLGDLLEVPAE